MNFSHLQRNSICIYGNVCLSDISQLLKLDISNCQAIPTNTTIVETFRYGIKSRSPLQQVEAGYSCNSLQA